VVDDELHRLTPCHDVQLKLTQIVGKLDNGDRIEQLLSQNATFQLHYIYSD
jgi:hypothetical protein